MTAACLIQGAPTVRFIGQKHREITAAKLTPPSWIVSTFLWRPISFVLLCDAPYFYVMHQRRPYIRRSFCPRVVQNKKLLVIYFWCLIWIQMSKCEYLQGKVCVWLFKRILTIKFIIYIWKKVCGKVISLPGINYLVMSACTVFSPLFGKTEHHSVEGHPNDHFHIRFWIFTLTYWLFHIQL